MGELVLASIVFVIFHLLPALKARTWIIDRIGDPAYMGLFSLGSVLGMAWMIVAYQDAPPGTALWYTGPALKWFTVVMMLIPFIFVVAGTTTRNPTSILGKGALNSSHKWNDIFAVTRHPVMWAIAIWAALHLLNRPEPRSLLLFGSMGLLGIAGSLRQEVRKSQDYGKAWEQFAAQTSFVPFAGILTGKAKLKISELGGWQLVVAVLLWLLVLYLHGHIFGISPLPI